MQESSNSSFTWTAATATRSDGQWRQSQCRPDQPETRTGLSAALEETNREKSKPFWIANLKLGYHITPKLQLSLDVLNLLDRQANDIEYWGGACTRSEQDANTCGGGIDGRLVHPLEPRTLRLSLRSTF